MKNKRLLRSSVVIGRTDRIDKAKREFGYPDRDGGAWRAMEEARQCWEALSSARARRLRCKRYLFGDQWGDLMRDPDSKEWIKEESYLLKNGKVPLKNNVIRPLVKNVLGQYRQSETEPICKARDRKENRLGELMSQTLNYVYQLNELKDLDARALEEAMFSGMMIGKSTWGWRDGVFKEDVWVKTPMPNRFFFDSTMKDPRHWDCGIVGELHDLTLDDVLSQFARTESERERLRYIYGDALEPIYSGAQTLSGQSENNVGFYTASQSGMCRVVEVWRKELMPRLRCHDLSNAEWFKVDLSDRKRIDADNRRRIAEAASYGVVNVEDVAVVEYEEFTDRVWWYYFLSPTGYVLREGESPFWHGEHPYSFKIYPFIDGEVHSLVEDVIDQQRYINRMVTMIDFIMGSSAKGVLMIPEDCESALMSREEVLDAWSKYNGVIYFKAKPGVPVPQQISTNATNVGAFEMLQLQLRLLDDISGVHGALQGKDSKSGMSNALYTQQSYNSSLNLVDFLASFNGWRKQRDSKIMKMVQQFYDEERYLQIAGEVLDRGIVLTAERVKNVEFDLDITQSPSGTNLQAASNEMLMGLYQQGSISLRNMLEVGSYPFGDKLLEIVKVNEEKMAQGGAADPVSDFGRIAPSAV